MKGTHQESVTTTKTKVKIKARTAKMTCAVYGEGVAVERRVLKWIAGFKAGDFNFEEQGYLGKPFTTGED